MLQSQNDSSSPVVLRPPSGALAALPINVVASATVISLVQSGVPPVDDAAAGAAVSAFAVVVMLLLSEPDADFEDFPHPAATAMLTIDRPTSRRFDIATSRDVTPVSTGDRGPGYTGGILTHSNN